MSTSKPRKPNSAPSSTAGGGQRARRPAASAAGARSGQGASGKGPGATAPPRGGARPAGVGPAKPGAAPKAPPKGTRPAAAPAPTRELGRAQASIVSNEPLSEQEMERLQDLLDAVPGPLEPLDISMLDGYLMGVLLQPRPVPFSDWAPFVLDPDGRQPPRGYDGEALFALVRRRYRELNTAIVDRQWFDPWVFELDEDAEPREVVYAWVAGFALASEHFPDLMAEEASELLEPLAQLYMHLDPDDLEDADDLLEEIESLEPPSDVAEAVECLVRASLLLADVTRPLKSTQPPARPGTPRRPGPGGRGGPPRRH